MFLRMEVEFGANATKNCLTFRTCNEKLNIDYQTLSIFEELNIVNRWGDIRLGSVTFNEQGNIDNGYILSYEGSNQDDSGDWLTFESGRENAEGEIVWGCEYKWRGYTWELSLYENGELRERIASEVYLSANETISVFMPLKSYRKNKKKLMLY